MAYQATINYGDVGIDLLNVEALTDPKQMENVALAITKKLSPQLKSLINSGIDETEYEDIYDHVTIGNSTVSDMVSYIIGSKKVSPAYREALGAICVARAHILGKKVTCFPVRNSDGITEIEIKSDGTLPNISDEHTLNLWQNFWSYFGFYVDELAAYEQRQFSQISSLAGLENLEELQLKEGGTHFDFVAANTAVVEALHSRHTKFNQEIKNEHSKISHQYLADIKPEEYDKEHAKYYSKNAKDTPPGLEYLPESPIITSRSAYSICAALMLLDGYSMVEISNSSHTEGRGKAGRTYLQIINDLKNPDATIKLNAEKKLKNVYIDAAKALLKQKMPSYEQYFAFDLAAIPTFVMDLHQLAKDLYQDISSISGQGTINLLADPENVILREKMGILAESGMGTTINLCYSGLGMNSLEENLSSFKSIALESSRNFTASVTHYSSQPVEDFIYQNQFSSVKVAAANAILFNNPQFRNKNFSNSSKDVISYFDVIKGDISVPVLLNSSPDFLKSLKNCTQESEANGSLEFNEAKLDLAQKITQAPNSQAKLNPEVSKELINRILKSDTFKANTVDKDPTEIANLFHDTQFIRNVMTSLVEKPQPEKNEKITNPTISKSKSTLTNG